LTGTRGITPAFIRARGHRRRRDAGSLAAPDQRPKITDPPAPRKPSRHGSSPLAKGGEESRGQAAGHEMTERVRLCHGVRAAAAGVSGPQPDASVKRPV
jgi:hypothetical protein